METKVFPLVLKIIQPWRLNNQNKQTNNKKQTAPSQYFSPTAAFLSYGLAVASLLA